MTTLTEMANAHLMNVQREIQNLTLRKAEIEEEIKKLQDYLVEGSSALRNDNVQPSAEEES